jgi:hypothetical protein
VLENEQRLKGMGWMRHQQLQYSIGHPHPQSPSCITCCPSLPACLDHLLIALLLLLCPLF